MNILKSKKAVWIFCIGIVVMLAFLFTFPYLYRCQYSLDIDIEEGAVIHIEYGVDKELPKVNAVYEGALFNGSGQKFEAYVDGSYDLNTLGTYKVVYRAEHNDEICKKNVTIVVEDTLPPTIELTGGNESFVSPNGRYEEEGYKAHDIYDGDLTESVVRTETDNIITYTVTDKAGNTAIVTRKITYKDTVPPVITLNGDSETTVVIGTSYEEPGYTAIDDCDGELSDRVVVEGSIDINKCGIYILKYIVKDSVGNQSVLERKVIVADMVPPTITLKGDTAVYVKLGETFTDEGCVANDNIDGDISDRIIITGSVDNSKVGQYNLVYQVTDNSGNKTEVIRAVYVYEKQLEAVEIIPGDKIVYLTFDDGPGPYTKQLLDILDKYSVKVTFFVTNQYPGYRNLIGEAYRKGHTIALHTYSHEYSEIYKNEVAYFEDLQKIQDIVVAQTGKEANIVRFPGGTSNSISRNYCEGIMTRLSNTMAYRGFLYSDWNVDSADAGGANTKEKVAANVIEGIKNRKRSIVLQHDIKKCSVEAVEEIIVWGLANGYTFLPMTENTPMVHHGVNN